MSDIEGSDAPVVKGFKGKEKEGEGQGKKEGKVTVGAMCRRRLAVVMVRLKMAETVKMVSFHFSRILFSGSELLDSLVHTSRLSLTSNKDMYELDLTRLRTLHSW